MTCKFKEVFYFQGLCGTGCMDEGVGHLNNVPDMMPVWKGIDERFK